MTISGFLAWADRRNLVSVRSGVLFVTVWMTWRVTEWTFAFAREALAAHHSGTETSLVIGAITVPFAALQAAAFKIYAEAK